MVNEWTNKHKLDWRVGPHRTQERFDELQQLQTFPIRFDTKGPRPDLGVRRVSELLNQHVWMEVQGSVVGRRRDALFAGSEE